MFLPDGQYVREALGAHRPDHVLQGKDGRLYLAELGMKTGLFPSDPEATPPCHPPDVKKMTSDGNWLGGWSMGSDEGADPIAAHAIGIDSVGDMYMGETLEGARILKYARVR